MGREIFDKLYKTLTEKYAKDNELLNIKSKIFSVIRAKSECMWKIRPISVINPQLYM